MKAKKALYCEKCGRKIRSCRAMAKRAKNDPNVALGVGSGGNQYGSKNHMFKDGLTDYRSIFYRDNPNQKSCEICCSDRFLVVHHMDRNRKNNDPSNMIMLCKSCHAKVHGCAANLGEIPLIEREQEE